MNTGFMLKILNICMTAGYGVWMYTIGEPGYAVVGIWSAGAMVYFRLQEHTTLPAQGSAYVETLRGKCTTPLGLKLLNCTLRMLKLLAVCPLVPAMLFLANIALLMSTYTINLLMGWGHPFELVLKMLLSFENNLLISFGIYLVWLVTSFTRRTGLFAPRA